MRSKMQLSNSSMLMLGLCVLVGSLFTIGAGVSSTFAAPPSDPNSSTDVSELTRMDKKLPSASRLRSECFGVRRCETRKPGSCGKTGTDECPGPMLVCCAISRRRPERREAAVDSNWRAGGSCHKNPGHRPWAHPFSNVQMDAYWWRRQQAIRQRVDRVSSHRQGCPRFKTLPSMPGVVRRCMNADQIEGGWSSNGASGAKTPGTP